MLLNRSFLNKNFMPLVKHALPAMQRLKDDIKAPLPNAGDLQQDVRENASHQSVIAYRLRQLTTKTRGPNMQVIRTDANGKPDIQRHVLLKDGRQAMIRRLLPEDLGRLNDFLDRADFLGGGGAIAYHVMGKKAAREYELDQIFGSARTEGYDVLIAEVDGGIEGVCDYRPVDRLEADFALMINSGFTDTAACISNTSVSRDARCLGIGTALKEAQMRSAEDAGYEAIIGMTDLTNAGVLRIVDKMKGKVVPAQSGNAWAIVPVRKD